MKKLQSIRNLGRNQAQGQSLVETAIIAPILIFMLIGVFEVGWALRGYLVLANVSREATRFSVRSGYMNFSDWPPSGLTTAQQQAWFAQNVGYNSVIGQMLNSLSGQVDTTGDAITPAMIVSHFAIDTGWPCDPVTTPANKHPDNISVCDCSKFDRKSANYTPNFGFTKDDVILHPGLPAYKDFYAFTYDPVPTDTITYTTTYSYYAEADLLKDENNLLNCQLLKRTTSATPGANYVVLTEMFYRQPQLFGFPLISNPVTDPVPMFAHTMMRIPPARGGNDRPVCSAYPFIVKNTNIPAEGTSFDIFGGNGPNDFGWLAWNPVDANTSTYLSEELKYPQMSMNDFYNNHDADDTTLSVGDWVASLPGTNATIESNDGLLTSLIGQKIRIPVWDNPFHNKDNTEPLFKDTAHYHIVGFIWVRIESAAGFANWTSTSDPKIYATYLGDASDSCPKY